jgi:hypothetical protein
MNGHGSAPRPRMDARAIRVTELFEAPVDAVRAAVTATVPDGVGVRISETGAGVYLTLERRLGRPAIMARSRAIRYLQGVVSDIVGELESPATRSGSEQAAAAWARHPIAPTRRPKSKRRRAAEERAC